MTRVGPAWRAGVLVLVVAVAVVNVLHTANRVPPPPLPSPSAAVDPVSGQERRLAMLRGVVQARGLKGAIGYFSDFPRERMLVEPQGVQDFYLAQFVLAPLVLDADAESHEWAVANLRSVSPQLRVPAAWSVEQDFGEGVLLLKKDRP